MQPAPADVYAALVDAHEVDAWWPVDRLYHEDQGTDPREEIVIGSVLVQNTGWGQAQRAMIRLKEERALDLESVATMDLGRLRDLVRTAGFGTRKPATLQEVARRLLEEAGAGGMERLVANIEDDPDPVRHVLLEVHGVGEETADAILAFAFDAPVLVVDTYMRRLMSHLGIEVQTPRGPRDPLKAPYQDVARWWTRGLPREAEVYKRLHAAIVEHGKGPCRSGPACALCHKYAGSDPKRASSPAASGAA